jgi:poly(A) polymerase Pap1
MDVVACILRKWNTAILLIPFGSVALDGVVSGHSDVDVLCVCPPPMTRHESTESLLRFLFLLGETTVRDIVAVRDTFVPVVKFVVVIGTDALHVDVVFAFVSTQVSPAHVNSIDDIIRIAVSDEDKRSLVGPATTAGILKNIRGKRRVAYGSLLRTCKKWAIDRNMYSNPMGLLNGVSLAVMVAYICSSVHVDYPNELLFSQFIRVYATWDWEKTPVVLPQPVQSVQLLALRWMNVWTPTVEPVNTLHNVGVHQRNLIVQEFRNALYHVQQPTFTYVDALPMFFRLFKYYASVRITTTFSSSHTNWTAMVASRMKRLIAAVDEHCCNAVLCTHTFKVNARTSFCFMSLDQPLADDSAVCQCFTKSLLPFPPGCFVCVDFILQCDLPSFVHDYEHT